MKSFKGVHEVQQSPSPLTFSVCYEIFILQSNQVKFLSSFTVFLLKNWATVFITLMLCCTDKNDRSKVGVGIHLTPLSLKKQIFKKNTAFYYNNFKQISSKAFQYEIVMCTFDSFFIRAFLMTKQFTFLIYFP